MMMDTQSESKRVRLCVFEIMSFITLFTFSLSLSFCRRAIFFCFCAKGKIGHLIWIKSKVAKEFCILNAFFIHR